MTRSSREAPEEAARPPVPIGVTFVGHATTLVEIGGVRVLTDPFLRLRLGPLERHGPLPDPARLHSDVVLISHGHRDHFDLRSVVAIPGDPTVLVPAGLGAPLLRAGIRALELRAGDSVSIQGATITAVPARHWISPGAARAQPLGYVIDGGRRVYFAGDTDRYPAMRDVIGAVDLALLPVATWGPHLGPGHLGPRTAAEVARYLGARAAIPIHWGTLYPRHLHRVWSRPLHEPGDRFAAYAGTLAPDIEVHVLRPGERMTVNS